LSFRPQLRIYSFFFLFIDYSLLPHDRIDTIFVLIIIYTLVMIFFLFIYDAYKNLVMIIYLNRALYTEYFFFFKHYLREPSMKFCVTAHFFQS